MHIANAAQKRITIPLSKIPKLKKLKEGVIVKFNDVEVLLIRTGKKTVSALDPTCTHRACRVLYKKRWKEIRCKCHGSKYALDGRVTAPPAERDLRRYPASLEGDKIVLSLGESEHAGVDERR